MQRKMKLIFQCGSILPCEIGHKSELNERKYNAKMMKKKTKLDERI